MTLKAPFPYFGGKSSVADLVWPRLAADVRNYIEPFAGSLAMLLRRPSWGETRIVETVNDVDCYVANFWRAVQADPEAVARYADWPVNEADLHARHRFLVGVQFPTPVVPEQFAGDWETMEAYLAGFRGRAEDGSYAAAFREKMRRDPEFYDERVAGWWCWGACCWIGGGWCVSPHMEGRGSGVIKPRGVNKCSDHVPEISGATVRGVHGSGMRSVRGRTASGDVDQTMTHIAAGGDTGVRRTGDASHDKRPRLAARDQAGVGVSSEKCPNIIGHAGNGSNRGVLANLSDDSRPQLADQYARGRGVNGHDSAEHCAARRAWLTDWMQSLADRLRVVRVCNGHWLRVCKSPSVTTRIGTTAVFLDPPYPTNAAGEASGSSRDGALYASDAAGADDLDKLRDEVLAYCIERGDDKAFRIAVCGYDTDGYQVLADEHGWEAVAWKAQGGYGNRKVAKGEENTNRGRERIWFSPHCVRVGDDAPLFTEAVT